MTERNALDAAGGSTAPRQVGDMTTRNTQQRILVDRAIPVAMSKKNEVNGTALANAYNKVQNDSTLEPEIRISVARESLYAKRRPRVSQKHRCRANHGREDHDDAYEGRIRRR